MHRIRLVSVLLVTVALLVSMRPTTVEACSCVRPDPEFEPLGLVRPIWPESSGLVLVSESIEIECPTVDDCHWRSVHVYQRSGAGEPARALARLEVFLPDSLTIRFGGQLVEVIGYRDEGHAEVVAAIEAERGLTNPGDRVDTGSFFWLEDDGESASVVLEIESDDIGEFHFVDEGHYVSECCRLNALEVRHPWVPTYTTRTTWSWLDPRAKSVARNARTRVTIEHDDSLVMEIDGEAVANSRIEAPSRPGLEFSLTDYGRLKGGPFIAVGGALLDANPVRGRIGWEHAEPFPNLFYSAALETDFTREFSVVPAIEVTHGRSFVGFLFPCAGIGVGVPVQILPDLRPGLRLQASLSWRMVSFLTTFDWLMQLPPRAGTERPTMYKLAFLGQLSF